MSWRDRIKALRNRVYLKAAADDKNIVLGVTIKRPMGQIHSHFNIVLESDWAVKLKPDI